jgi:RNA polymerase sigma factor (sigma-70 family)
VSGLGTAPADARPRSLPARRRANQRRGSWDSLLGSKPYPTGAPARGLTRRQLRANSQPSGMNDGGCIGHSTGRPHQKVGTAMTTGTINCCSLQATESVAFLLLRVRQGDATAWDEIFRRYGKLVTATVRSFRLQDADALDAIQMTWLRFAENAHQVRFPERLGGWLVTTARRECLRILRDAKMTLTSEDRVPEGVADPSVNPEQQVINMETVQSLHRLVAELPPRRRMLVRFLFDDDQRSYAEVARLVGIPPGGIGPTRARALRQLREKLFAQDAG